MTQQEIPIMKQVVKVLDLRPLMREYIDRERVKNNLISRLLGRLKENAIKNESLIGQDLGIVPTLSVESKKILQIEIFSVEKLEKKNILGFRRNHKL